MDLEKANRKFQKELNAGAVSIVLLGLLSEKRKALYGYEIARHLESRVEGELPMNQGALYPVLRSLEKQGLLSSEVQPSVSGPPRRYYKITADGRKALREWTAAWQRTKQFVDSVLENCDARNSPTPRTKISRSSRT